MYKQIPNNSIKQIYFYKYFVNLRLCNSSEAWLANL